MPQGLVPPLLGPRCHLSSPHSPLLLFSQGHSPTPVPLSNPGKARDDWRESQNYASLAYFLCINCPSPQPPHGSSLLTTLPLNLTPPPTFLKCVRFLTTTVTHLSDPCFPKQTERQLRFLHSQLPMNHFISCPIVLKPAREKRQIIFPIVSSTDPLEHHQTQTLESFLT